MNQMSLLQNYCIDTSAILDFWDFENNRPYDIKVKKFRELWDHISSRIQNGTIVVPKAVAKELTPYNDELKEWKISNNRLFSDHDDCLGDLGKIVNKYTIYTTNKVSLNDAIVVAIASTRNLTVITSEKLAPNHSAVRPKIPNVCEEFSVNWLNLPNYFAAENL